MNTRLILALLFYVSLNAYASTFPVQVDFCQFRGDSVSTSVLMSYAFADSILVYKRQASQFSGAMNFELEIRNSHGFVLTEQWAAEHSVASSSDPLHSDVLGQREFRLAPGQYKVLVRAIDAVRPKRHDSAVYDLVVRRMTTTKPTISELLVCQSIVVVEPSNEPKPFVRNGFLLLPKPSHELIGTSPVLHAYVEMYNLQELHADSVSLLYSIRDGAGRVILDAEVKRKVIASGQTDVFEQDLQFVPTGTYFLNCALLIPTSNGVDSSSTIRKFYILNPEQSSELSDLRSEDELFLASEFATMSDSTIEDEYRKAMAVGPLSQLVTYPQLTNLLAKQKFIFRFWNLKDPDPSTVVNERYESFKKAVRYAVLNYKNPFAPKGWDCDQGRVLMRYGFPTNIDRQLYNSDAAFPHETWTYDNIQGGVQFVFVNLYGRGRIVLVHSTAIGERRDFDWYNRFATDRGKRN